MDLQNGSWLRDTRWIVVARTIEAAVALERSGLLVRLIGLDGKGKNCRAWNVDLQSSNTKESKKFQLLAGSHV